MSNLLLFEYAILNKDLETSYLSVLVLGDMLSILLINIKSESISPKFSNKALLENLGEIDSDFIFINNIDNISPKTRTLRYEVSKSLFNIAYSNKRRFDMLLQTFSERKYNLLESLIAQFETYMPNHLKDKSVEQKVDLIIEMLNKLI